MILLLSLSLLTGIALADMGAVPDQIFVPAPHLQNTKYAADCGGDFPNLAPLMPPIDNQMQSPWCATFSAKALLDFFYNRAGLDPNYENRISTVDLNAANRFGEAEAIGRLPDIRGDLMPNAQAMLEGAQLAGRLYREEDLPFDQSYFDPKGDLARLSAYYELQRDFAGKPELSACRDQSELSVGLEKQFLELASVLASVKNKQQFFLEVAKGRIILPIPRAGAQKIELDPAFDIRSITPKSADALVEELQKNLRAHRPTAVGICAIPMMKLPGLRSTIPPGDEKKCGPHGVVVVGMQKRNGKCQIEIRNSWGNSWPEAGGGNAWLPLNDFLKVSLGAMPLVSISERKGPGGPKNRIDYPRDGAFYVGETLKMRPNGRGGLTGPGSVKQIGLFREGIFIEGIFAGPLDDGSFYKGEFKENRPNGKGKAKFPDGSLREGIFRDGEFISGHFKGLLDPARGLYYDGKLENGMAVETQKYTDKAGNPWKPKP